MKETIIRIQDDGKIIVEEHNGCILRVKHIEPDALVKCINSSTLRGKTASGLLPKNCISFTAYDNGTRDVCIVHTDDKADISYHDTIYADFPLPRLVFGFTIGKEGRIQGCRIGIVADDLVLKPSSPMLLYPFSNVDGFQLCTGNNAMPKCESLHQLSGLPYFILSMSNNNDYFQPRNNKQGLEMRDLLEHLKDKPPAYYYKEVLLPMKKSLQDFITI